MEGAMKHFAAVLATASLPMISAHADEAKVPDFFILDERETKFDRQIKGMDAGEDSFPRGSRRPLRPMQTSAVGATCRFRSMVAM
jgi:hypothetical protein